MKRLNVTGRKIIGQWSQPVNYVILHPDTADHSHQVRVPCTVPLAMNHEGCHEKIYKKKILLVDDG